MATNDAPLSITPTRGLSLALGQAVYGPLTDAQWAARLSRSGSGTADPTFDPTTDITYVGAFRIPHFSNDFTSLTKKTAIGFKAPEAGGRNGPNGSLFIGGEGASETVGGTTYDTGAIAEVQIPEIGTSTDFTQLPAATVLQNFVNAYRRAPIADTNNVAAKVVGALKLVGDKLYMSMHASYDADASNTNNVIICNDAKDMANATYQGFLSRDGEDRGAKYSCVIPPEHQATFGATHFSGIWASVSIIGRSSFGPALLGWNPSDIQPADTHVPATTWSFYGNATPVEFWDYQHEAVKAHYETELGVQSLKTFLDSDPSTRISTFDGVPLPDTSLYGVGGGVGLMCELAFIPPGTDTIVFIGRDSGIRYGVGYKGYNIEQGNTISEDAGYHPFSRYDYDNRIWTLNLNDIANAVNPSDPGFIYTGIFDSNRWYDLSTYRQQGLIIGGDFDPATGRLYVAQSGFYFNEFVTQLVVSVYQVGGGS